MDVNSNNRTLTKIENMKKVLKSHTLRPTQTKVRVCTDVVVRTETVELPLWQDHLVVRTGQNIRHFVACVVVAQDQRLSVTLHPHALALDPIYSCGIVQQTNVLVCWAHRNGLPVTLNPLDGEHAVLAPVRTCPAGSCACRSLLSVEPPLAVPRPRCLNLRIEAKDALATMVQWGGAIHSLVGHAADIKSLNELRCISVNTQLPVHVPCHCSHILLGVLGPVAK